MPGDVSNLRVRFYGVQGSSSTFPGRADREALRALTEHELLQHVLRDVGRYLDEHGDERPSLESLLGRVHDEEGTRAYRAKFDIPQPRIYGGWTTCVHVQTADGYDMVFDCGSGFRSCAEALQQSWGDRPERHLYVFGSHSHADHTEGFDLAAVCFDARNTLHIHGNSQFLAALDDRLGIFSRSMDEDRLGIHSPVHFGVMPATMEGVEIDTPVVGSKVGTDLAHRTVPGREPIVLGETTVTPFTVHHPAPCLGYRVERGGKVFVFCSDHELRRGSDPDDPRQRASVEAEERLASGAEGADLLYRDGQYLRAEYEGEVGIGSSAPLSRLDWGHSCIEDVEEMAVRCGVRNTLIGHHDPLRDWRGRYEIDEELRARSRDRPEKVELARAEGIIDL